MSSYRITNLTSATIIIEDLGVTLHGSGGRDSSAIVNEHQFLGSKDIVTFGRWIRKERIFESPVMGGRPSLPDMSRNITPQVIIRSEPEPEPEPRSASPAIVEPPSPVGVEPPSPVVVEPTSNMSTEIASLHSTIKEMNESMAKMVSILSGSHQNTIHSYGNKITPRDPYDQSDSGDRPIFIQNDIVPKDVKTNISVQHNESSNTDFNTAAEALKNIRKRK